ncbi:MAG: MmcQ/YjbR family DNA-binding protein [Anaerolineales bacterium]|nr:MmcQ/YjbR family DNA-binding protein [Anaerolineales bacterium]
MMTIEELRQLALALPEASESPHFDKISFRVRRKIFATVSSEGEVVHLFVGEPEREMMLASQPAVYEKLWWGKNVIGLRARLAAVSPEDIEELLRAAWRQKAPAALHHLLV